jgi:Predicted NADH:ubiquinone oxidoreductase, subunit RnfA
MNLLKDIILTLTAWMFTQNIILVKGLGTTISYNYAKQPFKERLMTATSMSIFVFIAMFFCFITSIGLSDNESKKYLIPLTYIIIICTVFLLVTFLLKKYFYPIYKNFKKYLTVAAFNSYIFAVLLINESLQYNFVKAIFFALFSGAAFLIASTVMALAVKATNNKFIPKSFRGFPAQMIFISILCLILLAFNGNKVI